MPKKREKAAQKRPNLKLLKDLPVMGGRYWFGMGRSKLGGGVFLYISTPGRGGVAVSAENLPAFIEALDEVAPTLMAEAETRAIAPCDGLRQRDPDFPQQLWSARFEPALKAHGYEEDGEGKCGVCGWRAAWSLLEQEA